MRQRRAGMNPLQAVLAERQPLEQWRRDGHGVNSSTYVVEKAWQGQLRRPKPSAGLRRSLEYSHRSPGLRQHNSGGQSVRSRTDHHGAISFLRGQRPLL